MRISDWSSDVCSSDLIILSSLVSHHMTPAQRSEFLRFMESEAARGWLVNDLHRQRLPFAGYPLLAGRKSTRLNSITNAHLVCRLLLEKKHKSNRKAQKQHLKKIM